MFHFRMPRFVVGALVSMAVAAFFMAGPVTGQTAGEPEEFTAAAVDLERGLAGTVEISIDRWSTPAEQRSLATTLLKKGSDALLTLLQGMRPVGRIRTPDSIGYELRFAQQLRQGDVRHIGIATDRPISFWELRNRPRSADYPFTFIELHMRADGTGEGKLSIAAKIIASEADNLIEIENFTIQPVRLEKVQSRKRS
jgi:hypothetical protein